MLTTYGFCRTYYITNREQMKLLILTHLDTAKHFVADERGKRSDVAAPPKHRLTSTMILNSHS